ncbi:MAG: hypothetical protein JW882_17215 [Deltaproteobacteria bacterium]|nr:hypothetical protein [Deltaproteobacteria bacterium]
MWLRWFPWKWVVSYVARAHGFVDPVKILFRLESFAQPMDIKKPIELLRAGMVFHARGLLNTNAIQHNLDWIWPYWVERQYNPLDASFIPRSFSITHVNLSHRNWTAIGIPDHDFLPIVDPRGLLTPFWDSWSLDVWLFRQDGHRLIPSKLPSVKQHLDLEGSVAVVTRSLEDSSELVSRAEVLEHDSSPDCTLTLSAQCASDAWIVVSARPYNPEGVSFISDIRPLNGISGWKINRRHVVLFDRRPEKSFFSNYKRGDVHTLLSGKDVREGIQCPVGMATAAALFPMKGREKNTVQVRVPLGEKESSSRLRGTWKASLAGAASVHLPDTLFQALYDSALRMLILHSPGKEVYPGPYTYKRFWFRDACFILHALLCAGLAGRARRVIEGFPDRQTNSGFFLSQEGEWDSNGEALWIMKRCCELTGTPPKPQWKDAIRRGGSWIKKKRLSGKTAGLHAGLLPAGFSAEHLGPNDYYFWDDFWGIAGLNAAADLLGMLGDSRRAEGFIIEAASFLNAVEESLAKVSRFTGRSGMPASPYRRMDSGAVGSLAAGYPLQIFSAQDERLLDTADFLGNTCLVRGGFFQDIIHSGINPYLTLHIAQVYLRAGDPRFIDLLKSVAGLASPTGQWPEAVHPLTLGGCMGDGNHVWAAAEWVLMMRNLFLREEDDRLFIAAGILPEWLAGNEHIAFGPGPTSFGDVSVSVIPGEQQIEVRWEGTWRTKPKEIVVHLPGYDPVTPGPHDNSVMISRKSSL